METPAKLTPAQAKESLLNHAKELGYDIGVKIDLIPGGMVGKIYNVQLIKEILSGCTSDIVLTESKQ